MRGAWGRLNTDGNESAFGVGCKTCQLAKLLSSSDAAKKNPMNHPSESSNDAVESVSTSLKVSDAWRLRPCLAELPELKPSAERVPGQGLDGAD